MRLWSLPMPLPELGDLAEDVRRVLAELERLQPKRCRSAAGECVPEVDVVETDGSFEILMDLPGVTAATVRVLIKSGTVVIAGHKPAPDDATLRGATFHRVERSFGRFARAVRLPGAIDAGRARARLQMGELVVSVPRIAERRGKEIVVTIE
jgi:HSP20 family protein